MKVFLKKQLAAVLAAAMALGTVASAAGANAGGGGAAGGGGSTMAPSYSLSNAVGYVYDYVDKAEHGAISGANLAAKYATASDITDARINELMTDGFIAKYDSVGAARADLVTLLGNSLAAYYSTNWDKFENNLAVAEDNVADVLYKIGVDSDDWFKIFIGAREDGKFLSTWNEMIVWAVGSKTGNTNSLTHLYETMDTLQVKAITKRFADDTECADIAAKFDELGWTAEKLVSATRAVAVYADPSKVAEFALIKAAARSGAEFKVDGVPYDNVGVNWENDVYRITPDELPITGTLTMEILGFEEAANFAGFETSNPEMVTMQANEADFGIDVTINNVRGAADIIIKRDPLGDNSGSNADWILRQKIVVAYDIAAPDAPTWCLGVDEGKILWDAVPNAVKYVVTIYKGNEVVGTKVVENGVGVDAADILAANGNGEYAATVTAYGELGDLEASVPSQASTYTYTAALDTVAKPTLAEEADKKMVRWTAVSNATKYVVYLYEGTAAEPFETIEVANVTECDVTEKLAGKAGTFYAAVQAKSETLTGAVSAKSDGLTLTNYHKITGYAKLENAEVGSVQNDNSGTTVSILELPSITAVTAADGSYTLEDIPSGNYTLVFTNKTRYYLKKHIAVTVSDADLAAPEAYMYFGDISSNGGSLINHFDLARMAAKNGSYDGVQGFDTNMDINHDGVIGIEELTVLLRNISRTTDNS